MQNKSKNEDLNLVKLSPYTYTFKVNENNNRIDYFYLVNKISYDISQFEKLDIESKKTFDVNQFEKYNLHSIYIYNQTDVLNDKYDNGREGLDGQNENLVAYIRYKNGIRDIFYILKDGNVVYDFLKKEKTDFEFDQ